jgi:hypothetical protein
VSGPGDQTTIPIVIPVVIPVVVPVNAAVDQVTVVGDGNVN